MSSINCHKPWYKHWWGVILAILIWPFFLLWFIWAKSKKGTGFKFAATCGVIALGIISPVILVGNLPVSNTAIVQPKPKPTPSLATLNTQVATILAGATANTEQLMTTGQAGAAKSNATTMTPLSPFETWRAALIKQKSDTNTNNAYTKAVALYTNAHKPVPAIIATWKKDNTNTYNDVGSWMDSVDLVLVDNLGGSSSSEVASDNALLASSLKSYQTDLNKSLGDISQLSGTAAPKDITVEYTPYSPQPTESPTESLAAVNAQVVSILTTQINSTAQLMTTLQSDASQSNAADSSSAFHQLYTQVVNGTSYDTEHAAYVKADNLYGSAYLSAPNALTNWDTDSGQTYTDVSTWTNDEWTLLVDQTTNNPQPSDQTTINSDLQAYKSDLAKAQADISQL